MKVSLFVTCLVDTMAARIGKNTVQLLERVGCEVDFPTGQTCCGQPAYNSGYLRESKEAMKRMMLAFKESEYVVAPSGSCVSMLKMYPRVFETDPNWADLAENLADKSFELTEFLVNILQVTDLGSDFKGKITYHPSCHMTRLLGVDDAPSILLNNVSGVEMIPLPFAEDCCGFGGTFAVTIPKISEQMVAEKSRHVVETEADYLVGGDMGCLMNIGGRLRRKGESLPVLHLTDVLIGSESLG